MNKKYLLRGIGIGLIIGSLVTFTAFKTMEPVSSAGTETTQAASSADTTAAASEEITTTEEKTEASTAATTQATTAATTKAEVTTEATTKKEEKTTTEATTEKETEETTKPETEATTEEATEKPTTEASKEDGKDASVTIESGMGSGEASYAIMHAGIIDDAEAFDDFLEANGYDSKLVVGTFYLNSGMSYEEIAKIITDRSMAN